MNSKYSSLPSSENKLEPLGEEQFLQFEIRALSFQCFLLRRAPEFRIIVKLVYLKYVLLELRQHKKNRRTEKILCFEFAACFLSPNRRAEKGGNFKPNFFFQSIESFLYCLSSNTNSIFWKLALHSGQIGWQNLFGHSLILKLFWTF